MFTHPALLLRATAPATPAAPIAPIFAAFKPRAPEKMNK